MGSGIMKAVVHAELKKVAAKKVFRRARDLGFIVSRGCVKAPCGRPLGGKLCRPINQKKR